MTKVQKTSINRLFYTTFLYIICKNNYTVETKNAASLTT